MGLGIEREIVKQQNPRGEHRTVQRRWVRLREAYVSGDAVWALLLLLVGSGGLVAALSLRVAQAHDPLGGRFFPVMISSLLMLAAVAILLTPLVRLLRGRDPVASKPPGAAEDLGTETAAPSVGPGEEVQAPGGVLERPLGRVLAMAAVSIVYVALLDLVGYIPATILGMAAALWVLRTRGLRRLLLGPVVMSVSLYLIFTYLLYVRLP